MKGRTGFTAAEQKKMRLSDETLEGLRVTGIVIIMYSRKLILLATISTVKSFVEMAKFLLKQPDVKFLLSERFCQDPLEAFFGHQRGRGGRNDNPTVQQFCKSTVSLRVQGSAALDPLRGNCRKRPASRTIPVDSTPLPKRKCTRKN